MITGMLLSLAACEEGSDGPPPSSTPPAGARLLDADVTPESIVSSVMAAKGEEKRLAAAAQWADQWITGEGWYGTIEKFGEENGRPTIWFKHSASPIIGGSFWVGVEVVDCKKDVRTLRDLSFTGRIEKVKIQTGGPFPEVQISIRNGKVL